ncbi:helix-turn-helix domain-containing protein [Alcaligenaceae bacterium]|nr:helix-turn-helix domain-containing protein [Alcaligenaceae bacterium]
MKPLTERELTCLHWAAIGKTSWEMGAILGLSERTINFHVTNACRKLGVHGRQAAITTVLRAGLLPALTEPLPSLEKTVQPEAQETHQA